MANKTYWRFIWQQIINYCIFNTFYVYVGIIFGILRTIQIFIHKLIGIFLINRVVYIEYFHRIKIQIIIFVLFLFQIMKNEGKRAKVEYFNLSLKSNSRFHVYFVYLVEIINSTNKQIQSLYTYDVTWMRLLEIHLRIICSNIVKNGLILAH